MEQTVDRENEEVEERAERIVALEERFREQIDEQALEDEAADATINLTPATLFTDDVRNARVVSIDEREQRFGDHVVVITVEVDGERRDYELPWPDDPTDSQEPLVRLCRHRGITPDKLADLTDVPVIDAGGTWKLFVPPGKRTQSLQFVLPGKRTVTIERVTLSSRFESFLSSLILLSLRTRAVNANGNQYSPFNVDVSFAVGGTALIGSFAGVIATATAVLAGASEPFSVGMMAVMFAVVFSIAPLLALADEIEDVRTIDLY